jgi:hypothetical protein
MLGETEKADEIQSVERPSSQEEENGAATLGQNQHTDRKEQNFSVVKNVTHKVRGLHSVKNLNLIQYTKMEQQENQGVKI